MLRRCKRLASAMQCAFKSLASSTHLRRLPFAPPPRTLGHEAGLERECKWNALHMQVTFVCRVNPIFKRHRSAMICVCIANARAMRLRIGPNAPWRCRREPTIAGPKVGRQRSLGVRRRLDCECSPPEPRRPRRFAAELRPGAVTPGIGAAYFAVPLMPEQLTTPAQCRCDDGARGLFTSPAAQVPTKATCHQRKALASQSNAAHVPCKRRLA